MKTTLFTLLVLIFSTSTFADTKIDTNTCLKLKLSVGTGVFSRAAIVGNLKIKKIESDRTVEYFDTVHHNLTKDLEKYCIDNKVTIESLIKYHDTTCDNHCGADKDLKQKRGLFDEDKIFSEAEIAFQVCSSLCKEGAEKLKIFKMGADVTPKEKSNHSPDCTGAVSDKGRGIEVKSLSMEEDPGNAVAKQLAKKASGK
jgi:hypothetical protein